ncbi:hypothetical protein [Streptomyces sp. NPDC058653]|uniref:hypothetical protein n=1 Tax=Streptomyces sp. NPDC058653 TaxID=3346576 RepID=UPI003654B046
MRVPNDVHQEGEGGGHPVLLLAGLADLALSTCGSALKAAGGLLSRSDIGALAAQGREDLRARGRLAMDRTGASGPGTGTDPTGPGLFGTGGEAHMEVLARHAQHRAASAADGGPGGPGA